MTPPVHAPSSVLIWFMLCCAFWKGIRHHLNNRSAALATVGSTSGFFSIEVALEESMTHRISVTVNGTRSEHEVEARLLLVQYLRDVLGLTGTHIGCETSLCGACTVLVDGEAVKSCTMLAVQADGLAVTTIEGLAAQAGMDLHPIQEAFWECHGLQCGFCTPGMILLSAQILARDPNPSESKIRHELEGNLCRCTGYQHIVDAIQYASKKSGSRDSSPRG